MASTPPKANPTNLFGALNDSSASSTPPKGGSVLFSAGGSGSGKGSALLAPGADSTSTSAAGGASSWFEEDDEFLLSQLLLGEDNNEGETVVDLDDKLNSLKGRLYQDLSRISLTGTEGGDAWWNRILDNAQSSGFTCQCTTSNNSSSSSVPNKELPKSFNTPEGQSHIRALVDLLGISRERAVQITLASLRTFASVGGSSTSTDNDDDTKKKDVVGVSTPPSTSGAGGDSDKENDGDSKGEGSSEHEAKLRSLLGTKALYHRVLHRHRQQFLARLRVLTESLRLEQETKDSDDDDESNGVGKSCAKFLDQLDGSLVMNGKKRGLFQLLLRLATGPPLPGIMGGNNGELPYSVSKLRGGSLKNNDVNELGGEESLLAIRNEAAEALLVLLYDRIEGGVQRLDLFLVLECASRCDEYEFGMNGMDYSRRGRGATLGGKMGGWQTSTNMMTMDIQDQQDLSSSTMTPMQMIENMKCRLNGLWALICAECMGLWRANGNGNNQNWAEQHPFFMELDQQGTQKELKALHHKLNLLGHSVRERRQVAYNNSRKQGSALSMEEDSDDALWGVQAPEAVALLTFGLLLRLLHTSSSNSTSNSEFLTQLGEWGSACAQMANDDCGAFSYLHLALEWMVLDPLKDVSAMRQRLIGDNELVKDLLKRGDIEMINDSSSSTTKDLATMDEEHNDAQGEEDQDSNYPVPVVGVSDAASIVYASIGREILSSTICAFRDVLLSLQQSSAIENIGMLANLATVIYRNEKILCEQFWLDWEDFCHGMNDEEVSNDDNEPMCYLLDAAHSLAVSTLEELKKHDQQQAIIHYLKPLSTFIHLIASLCASSPMVQSILTSDFLPEGLLPTAMSVVNALAVKIPNLNEAANGGQGVTCEERSTIRHATAVLQSISTLAYLGGKQAREWIRNALHRSRHSGPRMIFNIASHALPHTQNSFVGECAALSSSALNLLVDLLVDADVAFQLETCTCFAPSSSGIGTATNKISGFAPFVSTGYSTTLASMSILNCLAINLTQNAFNTSASSAEVACSHIETIGGGVMASLDVLCSFILSGEVSFPATKVQVGIAHAILSSIVGILVSLKQIIYLHEDNNVQSIALAVRNDVITALSSSTPLGQVVAFLASAPVALNLTKKVSSSKELARVMDSASSYQQTSKQENSSKYGRWGAFVTPKRARQRASTRPNSLSTQESLFSDDDDHSKDDVFSGLYDVVVSALSLLVAWGEHAEDIADLYMTTNNEEGNSQDLLLQNSPCALLMSRATPSHHRLHNASGELNVANLNLVSRLISTEDVLLGGFKSHAALLATKVVKMCLGHAAIVNNPPQQAAARGGIGLGAFRVALGGGNHFFKVLLAAFDSLHLERDTSPDYFEQTGQIVLMASTMLETLAICVKSQPDLARAMLLGGETKEDWRLVDKIVSCVLNTIELMTNSRDGGDTVDKRVVISRSLLTCACLYAISELWNSCRLACQRKSSNSENVHACGVVVSYLTNANKTEGDTTTLIANITSELTRCSLLAIMALEEKELSTAVVHQKCILLDILTRSLDIIGIETVSRVQTKSQGGIKFVEDLFEEGPMQCWRVLLCSCDTAASAASSWMNGFTSSVGKSNASNWNVASFLQANPAEKNLSTSSWCALGPAGRLTKALSSSHPNKASLTFRQCTALHALSEGEASFCAAWPKFVEVVTANIIATRPSKEVDTLASVLANSTLAALVSLSESKLISQSLLTQQGLLESRSTKPIGELCSILLYSLTVRDDCGGSEDAQTDAQDVLEMIDQLYEAANKLFVVSQLGSVTLSSQESVCSIRQKLMTSALVLISEFDRLPKEGIPRQNIVKYNELRIGFTNLAVNALQSLQYVQLGDEANVIVDDAFAPSKYGYSFGATAENSSDVPLLGQEAAFQLLRASLSLLSRLTPITMGSSSKHEDYQTYAYGVDFAACLKERNAFHFVLNHLETASNIASLTYEAVHAGSSTHSVAVIHNNAVDIVRLVTSFFHSLTDSGSTVVDVLLLLMENRFFRSLIENPLLKTASKMWTSAAVRNGVMPAVTQHRGYYTSLPMHAGNLTSSTKSKPSSQNDPVHVIWRDVINIFSSLLRSSRCQSKLYSKVDEPILRQLVPATSAVFDFICTYENEIFSCFSCMMSEASAQSSLSNRGGKGKSSSFSSSIQSSSNAFTPSLLKEAADISMLFAELCKGDNKNQFARQCSGVYHRIISASLELAKIMSSFLGSIGNARDLFLALSSASGNLSNPAAMIDAHPLLAEGIPNARHEAIRNAHFAHSCCIIATIEDFKNSHIATTKAAESSGSGKSLEQSFQIQVNNKYIAEVEEVAAHCLFNALSVASDTHPASNSFVSISTEEASRLDVSAVITPGTTTVAICPQTQEYSKRYLVQPHEERVRYARVMSCDKSTSTISVKYSDTETLERNVPWSRIVGIEDVTKRQCILSNLPAPKSIAEESQSSGPPSLGNLILALKWCRHVGSTSLDPNASHCPIHIVKCVAERSAILLCTEVLLHDELRDANSRDDTARKVNMQLLDLFDYDEVESGGLRPRATLSEQRNLALVMGEDVLQLMQKNLKPQLQAASTEREEEQKIWEQNNSGWESTSFWGSKRQGRRSPFRMVRKTSSDLS